MKQVAGGIQERERGTIENVKILKHLVGKSKVKRKKKMYALFIDLRATFDNLDRRVMENDEGKRNQGRNVKVRKIYRQNVEKEQERKNPGNFGQRKK